MGSLSLTASKYVQKKGFGTLLSGVYHAPYPDCYRMGKSPVDAANRVPELHRRHAVSRRCCRRAKWRRSSWNRCRARAAMWCRRAEFFDGLRDIARAPRHPADRRRSAERHGPHGPMVGVRAFWFRAGHYDVGQGDCERHAAGGDDRARGGDDVEAGCACFDVRRESDGGGGVAGDDPAAGGRNSARMRRRWARTCVERMDGWPARFRHVGQVRGLGLMIGVEIVEDPETRARAPAVAGSDCGMAFERGLLILGAGPSALRLSPPLVLTVEQADFAMDALEECIGAIE